MNSVEIYETKTGNKQPDNQIAYHEWYIEYVKWLESEVEKMYENPTFNCKHKNTRLDIEEDLYTYGDTYRVLKCKDCNVILQVEELK